MRLFDSLDDRMTWNKQSSNIPHKEIGIFVPKFTSETCGRTFIVMKDIS